MAPTPMKATPPVGIVRSRMPEVTVVGAWRTCFRPEVVTVPAGSILQWQNAAAGHQRVILDDGTDLGPVRHVLEVRFSRAGSYRYHGTRDGGAAGTVIVQGETVTGAAIEVVTR